MTGSVRGTGIKVEVQGTRLAHAERMLDAAMAYAEKAGTHVWMAMAAFALSEREVKAILNEEPRAATFDQDSLRTLGFGCFRCEEPLSRQAYFRRCPGEPR